MHEQILGHIVKDDEEVNKAWDEIKSEFLYPQLLL